MDEWYSRECEFCTKDAALACQDTVCRSRGYGEPHLAGCPAIQTRETDDCLCVRDGA